MKKRYLASDLKEVKERAVWIRKGRISWQEETST